MRSSAALIESLVEDLAPVRRLDARTAMAAAALVAFATIAIVAAFFGVRSDIGAGAPDTIFLLANGLIFILALASSMAVIGMSRPGVGQSHSGWIWAAISAALLPLGAIYSIAVGGITPESMGPELMDSAHYGVDCMIKGVSLGLGIAIFQTLLLRKGAPTSPERAGWLVGVAAGSVGSFAYGLHCPINDLTHLGLWHILPIILSAAIARALVPPLIRW